MGGYIYTVNQWFNFKKKISVHGPTLICVCARVLLGSFLLCFAWHESTTTLCLEHWVAWLCFVHAWFHCLLFFIYCKLQQHTKLPCHGTQHAFSSYVELQNAVIIETMVVHFSLIHFIITTKFCIYILQYIVVCILKW